MLKFCSMFNVVLNGGSIHCKSIKIMAKNNTIKSNKKQSDSKKRNYKFSFLTAFIFLLSISLIILISSRNATLYWAIIWRIFGINIMIYRKKISVNIIAIPRFLAASITVSSLIEPPG